VAEKLRRIQQIFARAREYNFLFSLFAAAVSKVSALGALALRAYQTFGFGVAAILAGVIAFLGIWGIPRLFKRVRPRRPTLSELGIALAAVALVLFVWTANSLPSAIEYISSVAAGPKAASSAPSPAPASVPPKAPPVYLAQLGLAPGADPDPPLRFIAKSVENGTAPVPCSRVGSSPKRKPFQGNSAA